MEAINLRTNLNSNQLVTPNLCNETNRGRHNALLNAIVFMFQTMLMFFYIYEFNLSTFGLPSAITSRRIVVALFGILFIVKAVISQKRIAFLQNKKSIFYIFFLLISFLVYVSAILMDSGYGDGNYAATDIIEFFLFTIVPLFFISSCFDSKERFLKCILASAVIQTAIIIMCQINSPFCHFIDYYFSADYEYVTIHRSVYAGGLACITAPGFFRYSTGLFTCIYFLFKNKKIRFLFLYFIMSFVGSMIARTGLLVSTVGLLFILCFFVKKTEKKHLLRVLLFISILFVCVLLFLNTSIAKFTFGDNIQRFVDLIKNGIQAEFLDGYFGTASGNILPPLNRMTFFGTGMTYGTSANGVSCNVDGGYFKLFFAFGLIGSICFYSILLLILLKSILRFKNQKPLFYSLVFFLIIIIIGEFKEYIVFTQYMLFIMLGLISLKTSSIENE